MATRTEVWMRFASLSIITLALTSCGGDGGGTGPDKLPTPVATSISVSPASGSLVSLGATIQFTAQVKDQSGLIMSGVTVNWSSSNPGVANIVATGLSTAVSVGTTTITASAGSTSGTASLSVTQVIAAVTVAPASTTLVGSGATTQLSAEAKDANGNVVQGGTFTWNSSDENCVQVDANGLATSGLPGTVSITATGGGVVGSAEITVLPAPVATVEVTPSAGTLMIGGTLQLTAVTKDASGNVLTGRTVTWTASNAVVVVDATGLVTGQSAGQVVITAMSEGKGDTALITVQSPVASVVMTGKFRIKVGDTYTYSATAKLADGTVVDRPMTWSILEVQKGTMTTDGNLTPLETGTITLQVTIDGKVWWTEATAYDWESLVGGTGNLYLSLFSDIQITNKWGTSGYPELTFTCATSGKFYIWVDTQNFVTASGSVTYWFDDGPSITETWFEIDNFSVLAHSGLTNLPKKVLAQTMSLAREWGFIFREFSGPLKGTSFRVTGLGPELAPLLAACPNNNLVAEPGSIEQELWNDLKSSAEVSPDLAAERLLRRELGPQSGPGLDPRPIVTGVETRIAVRRH